MQILTEMLFRTDYAQFTEKRVLRYVEDTNPEYEALKNEIVQTHEYGTMLLELAETDAEKFDSICLPAAEYIGCMNLSEAQGAQKILNDLAERTRPLLTALPDLFCVYREKGIRAIDAVLTQSTWDQLYQQSILEGFKNIFLDAHTISTYIGQLRILLNANAFSDKIYSQKADATMRMDLIYKLLGTRDEEVNRYFNAPSQSYTGLDAPTDYSFLRDAEIRQILTISEHEEMQSFEFYNRGNDTMQSVIIAYIKDILEQNAVIRKCKHCRRNFVAQSKTIYCERTTDEQGNTCRQIGAMARYTQTLDSSPEKKAYRQTYKNNFAKMKKGALPEAEFEQWKQDAKILRKEVESGTMTAEAFLDWLKYGE